MKGEIKINIITTHSLAHELLNKPDDYLTVSVDNREYIIKGIKPIKTHANYDDSFTHKSLICEESSGNIIR